MQEDHALGFGREMRQAGQPAGRGGFGRGESVLGEGEPSAAMPMPVLLREKK